MFTCTKFLSGPVLHFRQQIFPFFTSKYLQDLIYMTVYLWCKKESSFYCCWCLHFIFPYSSHSAHLKLFFCLLKNSQWFPIVLKIKFNSLLIDYKTLHDLNPAYLSDLTVLQRLWSSCSSKTPRYFLFKAFILTPPLAWSFPPLYFARINLFYINQIYRLCQFFKKITPSKLALHRNSNYLPQYPDVFSPSLPAIILLVCSFVFFAFLPSSLTRNEPNEGGDLESPTVSPNGQHNFLHTVSNEQISVRWTDRGNGGWMNEREVVHRRDWGVQRMSRICPLPVYPFQLYLNHY